MKTLYTCVLYVCWVIGFSSFSLLSSGKYSCRVSKQLSAAFPQIFLCSTFHVRTVMPIAHYEPKTSCEGIAPAFIISGTSWTGTVRVMLWSLHPMRKIPQHILDRRLGVPCSCSGCGEQKNLGPDRNQTFIL
jgi:hypothetical protein